MSCRLPPRDVPPLRPHRLAAKVLTNNTGTMVTSAQEDNGTLESLMRGHLAGLVDYGRVIVMRTVSDFLIGEYMHGSSARSIALLTGPQPRPV